MPAAFAIGGILAEFISVRMLICGSFLITPVCFVPMMFVPDIVRLINFNAEPQPPGGGRLPIESGPEQGRYDNSLTYNKLARPELGPLTKKVDFRPGKKILGPPSKSP